LSPSAAYKTAIMQAYFVTSWRRFVDIPEADATVTASTRDVTCTAVWRVSSARNWRHLPSSSAAGHRRWSRGTCRHRENTSNKHQITWIYSHMAVCKIVWRTLFELCLDKRPDGTTVVNTSW